MKGQKSTILQALWKRRLELGYSQQTVAELAGLTQTYLSRIEGGKVDPRLQTLQDIARALRLEIALVPLELMSIVQNITAGNRAPEESPLFQADL